MQLDAMTEISTETSAEGPAAATTPRHKERSAIVAGVVTFNDAEPYAMADLSAPVQAQLAAIGLRYVLVQAEDRPAAFAKLKAGTVPGPKAAKAKELEPKRKAIALAMADAQAAMGGVKRFAPGGKTTPDYALILEDCEQAAAALDRAGTAAWMKKRAVMEHLAKLIGE